MWNIKCKIKKMVYFQNDPHLMAAATMANMDPHIYHSDTNYANQGNTLNGTKTFHIENIIMVCPYISSPNLCYNVTHNSLMVNLYYLYLTLYVAVTQLVNCVTAT